jgi:uncharacterized protein (TIGR02757 family)
MTEYKKIFREKLDKISSKFNFAERIDNDPVCYVRRFKNIDDRETAGLISSAFAYGNVNIIIKTLGRIFNHLGSSPSDFLKNRSRKQFSIFDDFYYRFNNSDDLKTLLWTIGEIQIEWGSLETLFLKGYKQDSKANGGNFAAGLEHFSSAFNNLAKKSPYTNRKNFEYFFPFPSKGSPCKRLCLFMRWMNRSDNVDPGGWKGVNLSDLIIPLDTHIARIGKYLGFTKRKNADWRMAVEITESLKAIDPEDPLKYDFVLCHMGISGECPRKFDPEKCDLCILKNMCIG